MKKSNDTYAVVFRSSMSMTERYYRDDSGWLKVSSRGRVFRMTAEHVLNHLLPALAFSDQLGLTVTVEHHERPYWQIVAETVEEPRHPSAESRSRSTPG